VNVPDRRLAVLGSPIAHSKSPALHRAAYATLGLAWQYDAIETDSDDLASFVDSRDMQWRGLSLTMPLKRAVLPLLDSVDRVAAQAGAANTLLFDDASARRVLRGFNTDVYGIATAFRAAGNDSLRTVYLLGSGATATSALLAVASLGAERVVIFTRTPIGAAPLETLGTDLGVSVEARGRDTRTPAFAPDAVISTIPGGTHHGYSFDQETMNRSVLFDVAYDPWPSTLATEWLAAGGSVISGLEMLLHQALAQVRIFVGGDPDFPLANESAVLGAMRDSIS
jgi:shikimate dehydrogenase